MRFPREAMKQAKHAMTGSHRSRCGCGRYSMGGQWTIDGWWVTARRSGVARRSIEVAWWSVVYSERTGRCVTVCVWRRAGVDKMSDIVRTKPTREGP